MDRWVDTMAKVKEETPSTSDTTEENKSNEKQQAAPTFIEFLDQSDETATSWTLSQ